MIIESDPERSHRRECGLAQLAEHERSNEITAPMSLDLEILPLNYQLPRYFVPTNCTDFAEQLCPSLTYGIDCDSCSLLDSIKESNNASVIKRADPSNFHQIENEGMHEESQLTMGHHSKKKRTYNRKSKKVKTQLVDEENNLGPNYSTTLDDFSREDLQFKKGKSFSEPTTADSSTTIESVSFSGLAGSHPYFKKSTCASCQLNKIVFWFGDSSEKNKGDKFLCAECIKAGVGEERFFSLFQIDSDWPAKATCELSEKKNSQCLKEFVLKAQISDPLLIAINYLLENKMCSVKKALSKMSNRLTTINNKDDLESVFLCLRFIHKLIEDLSRIAHLLSLDTFEKKLEFMDGEERVYFQAESKKMESLILTLQTEVVKIQEAERIRRHLHQAQNANSVQRLGFSIDFDEPSSLGKREPLFKPGEGFNDFEELEFEGYKTNTHNFDILMSQF